MDIDFIQVSSIQSLQEKKDIHRSSWRLERDVIRLSKKDWCNNQYDENEASEVYVHSAVQVGLQEIQRIRQEDAKEAGKTLKHVSMLQDKL